MEPKVLSFKKESPSKTYENINRLLEGKPEETYSSLIECAGKVNTLDSYEKSVRLIIIDSLKSKEGVIQALLSNDLQQIRRALQCSWFFEDAILPDFYKTNIFPKVSFSTRCKIIHQLSKHLKHEDHAEELFKYIKDNYGKSHAVILLPKCRPEFIASHLKSEMSLHFTTWRRTLLKLMLEYPQVVLEVLEGWCKLDCPLHNKLSKCSKIFLYLAKQHPNLFLPFFEKNISSLSFLRFGNKLRRSLSPAFVDAVLKPNRDFTWKMYEEEALFRELDFQGKVNFLAKFFSAGAKSFLVWESKLSRMLPFIKFRPANERAELIEAVFQKVFGENLWVHPGQWTLRMLELMPLEIREKCVTVLSNDKTFVDHTFKRTEAARNVSDQLAYLLDCKKSIPKLKEMIKKMPSADDRRIVLLEMVRSCSINKDFGSLFTVCDYIKNRHRNEDSSIIKSILESIYSFDTRKFDLNLWIIIEELITMCMLISSSSHGLYESMIEKYAFFRLENNLDPSEQIKNLAKYLILHRSWNPTLIRNYRLPYADVYFLKYYDELIRVINEGKLSKEEIKYAIGKILDTLNKYNSCHEGNKILSKDLEGLIPCLDNLFNLYNENYDYLYGIISSMSKDSYLKEKYTRFCNKEQNSNVMHLLKKNPNQILENHEKLFDLLFKNNQTRFIQNIYISKKIFDFYNASEVFKNFTSEKFQKLNLDHDHVKEKAYALTLHSHFADISEYEALIKDFLPKSKEIDYTNDSDEFVEIQIIVPKLIKNMQPQSKNFPLIFKFLLGDYLKYVLGSFNAACYNSPVEMVLSVLKEKIDTPVSVKKAILRNFSAICTLEEKIKFWCDLWEKEKHDSIRTVIFKGIIEVFMNEPTDESFKAIKKCILESTEVTIEARPGVKEIPDRYKNEYAEAVWNFADGITENDKLKINIKNSLIEEFHMENITSLSDELCEEIIKSEIFMHDSKLQLENFTFYYLVSDPDPMRQKSKFLKLLDLMTERKENQGCIASFLKALGVFSLRHAKPSYEIFDVIITNWPSIFPKYVFYEEYLMLLYYKIFHVILNDEGSSNIENLTIKFADELKSIIKSTTGYQELLMIFHSTIDRFLGEIDSHRCPLNNILLIRRLITPLERFFAILGTLLLRNDSWKEIETDDVDDNFITLDKKRNIKYIHETLKNFEDDLFQIYYYRKFKPKNISG